MVVTIEPAVYVPFSDRYPKHFQGLGIRIEDDILVQHDHHINLTANCPKEIADVEAACQNALEAPPDTDSTSRLQRVVL